MFSRSDATSVPGVLFIESFDEAITADPSLAEQVVPAPMVEVVKKPEPDERRLTATDLERLLSEAHEAGLAAGAKAAEDKLNFRRLAVLERVESELADASRSVLLAVEQHVTLIARVVLSLLTECLPAFCERHGKDEMLRFVRSLLPTFTDEPLLTVTVDHLSTDLVRQELSLLADRMSSRVRVVGCPDMPPGDVRLNWQSGAACRDVRQLRARMLQRLTDVGLLDDTLKDCAA